MMVMCQVRLLVRRLVVVASVAVAVYIHTRYLGHSVVGRAGASLITARSAGARPRAG